MLKALVLAGREVGNALTVGFSEIYKTKYPVFDGKIGQTNNSGPYVTGSAPVELGFTLKTKRLDGAQIVINAIGGMFSQAIPDFVLRVYKNGVFLDSFSFDVAANSTAVFPLKTTDYDERIYLDCDGSSYTFQYTTTPGAYPLNNRLYCGCGSVEKGLIGLLEDGSVDIKRNVGYGILLQAKTSCNFSSAICPYVDTEVGLIQVSTAIQYRAAWELLEGLYRNNKINAYKLSGLSEKDVLGNLSHYGKVFRDTIQAIVEANAKLQPSPAACFTCQSTAGFRIGKLTL